MQFVSWDQWMSETPSQLSISGREAEHWSAETIYDVRWAATVVENALRQVGEEFEKKGRRRVFDVLSSYLEADRQDVSYTSLSKTLGVPETNVKRLVHQMRQRYRALLREQVAQTVENTDDVDEELRYLCAALAVADKQ